MSIEYGYGVGRPVRGGLCGEGQEKHMGTLMFYDGHVAYIEDTRGKVRMSAFSELQFLDRNEFELP